MSMNKKNIILTGILLIAVVAVISVVVTDNSHISLFSNRHWLLGVPIRWTIPYLTWS